MNVNFVNYIPLIMTKKDFEDFKHSTNCQICIKKLMKKLK